MNLLKSKLYQEGLNYRAGLALPWNSLQRKSILISGGGGLVASCFIDVVMKLNGWYAVQSNFPWM